MEAKEPAPPSPLTLLGELQARLETGGWPKWVWSHVTVPAAWGLYRHGVNETVRVVVDLFLPTPVFRGPSLAGAPAASRGTRSLW